MIRRLTHVNARNVSNHFSNGFSPETKFIWIRMHIDRYSAEYIMLSIC